MPSFKQALVEEIIIPNSHVPAMPEGFRVTAWAVETDDNQRGVSVVLWWKQSFVRGFIAKNLPEAVELLSCFMVAIRN